jgi:hypothetical protein
LIFFSNWQIQFCLSLENITKINTNDWQIPQIPTLKKVTVLDIKLDLRGLFRDNYFDKLVNNVLMVWFGLVYGV